jgi:hypothetical protein
MYKQKNGKSRSQHKQRTKEKKKHPAYLKYQNHSKELTL